MTDVQPRIADPISEALSIAEAVDVANKSPRTIRERRYLRDLGRRIGGQRDISRVALAMFLDGDKLALEGYLAGDRTSPTVTGYFTRCGVPLPRRQNHGLGDPREPQLSELNGASKP